MAAPYFQNQSFCDTAKIGGISDTPARRLNFEQSDYMIADFTVHKKRLAQFRVDLMNCTILCSRKIQFWIFADIEKQSVQNWTDHGVKPKAHSYGKPEISETIKRANVALIGQILHHKNSLMTR